MLGLSFFSTARSVAPVEGPATTAETAETASLELLLEQMCAYGKPRLGVYSSGWYCKVEMTVPLVGTSFDVASEFGHSTPIAATRECFDRVQVVVKQWGRV